MFKRSKAVLAVLSLGVAALLAGGKACLAAEENEPNNLQEGATQVVTGEEYSAELTHYSDVDYYVFLMPANGSLSVELLLPDNGESKGNGMTLELSSYYSTGLAFERKSIKKDLLTPRIFAKKGTPLYICVKRTQESDYINHAPYSLQVYYDTFADCEEEHNNELYTATKCDVGKEISGNIWNEFDTDYYSFIAPETGDYSACLKKANMEDTVEEGWEINVYDPKVAAPIATKTGITENGATAVFHVTKGEPFFVNVALCDNMDRNAHGVDYCLVCGKDLEMPDITPEDGRDPSETDPVEPAPYDDPLIDPVEPAPYDDPVIDPVEPAPYDDPIIDPSDPTNAGDAVGDAVFEGHRFVYFEDGTVRCFDQESGVPVINEFSCDGVYTYYFQADGTAMRDRLTYHPDGVHVIYFDEYGHEVFSDFAHVKQSISGNPVDDFCFFNVFGYMYVDVLTYDKTGSVLYYANPYGVMEMNKWFVFSNTVLWADGTEAPEIAGQVGFASEDGTLVTNRLMTDWEGRSCYLQGNGVANYDPAFTSNAASGSFTD